MNTLNRTPNPLALVAAVELALIALAAAPMASAADDDDALRQQTRPTSVISVGLGTVSRDSFKFGEYNGLDSEGVFGILDFVFAGGGHYDSGDATRWRVVGNHLGLDTRDLAVEYGEQGRFRLNLGYDELQRNRSDSYQTPYLGAGGSVLTLPVGWLRPQVPQVSATALNFRSLDPTVSQGPALVGGVLVQPTAAQLAQLNAIAAADRPLFHNVDLKTKRERIDGGFSIQLNRQWDIKVSAQNERKDGLKPMSTVSSLIAEFAAVIPDRIDQDTQQYNISLNYTGDRAYAQFGYYGSIYDNHVDSMTWADVNDPTRSVTMSSAPSNEFHQFSAVGGWRFSPTTKLVVNAAYARNTQNDSFLVNPQLPLGLPVDSLDGLVVTKSFNAKFSSRPFAGFNIDASYKYDDHDNRTAVHTYIFQDANEARAAAASAFNAVLGLAPNTLGSNINIYANRPYSKKLNQFDAAADYAIATGQVLKASYQYQQIERGCPGSWINCADAPKTREHSGLLEWRTSAIENLGTSLSYGYGHRTVNYDENAFLALVPMAGFIPAGGATMSVYDYLVATGLTGFGPYAGFPAVALTGNAAIFSPNNNIVPQALYGSRNNINELLGLRRYNMADRNREKVRARFDWQASEPLSIVGSVDFDNDGYNNSLYGLTGSRSLAMNLDGAYAISEASSLDLFYSYEDRSTRSAGRAYGSNSNTAFVGIAANTAVSGGCFATVQARNNNVKIDPCLDWTSDSKDKVSTFGLGVNRKGLAGGRLDLGGELSGSRARTKLDVRGGSYVNNPLAAAGQPAVTPAVIFIPAEAFPTAVTKSYDFRLKARWTLNRASDLGLLYWYSHLAVSDYFYDGVQFGTTSIVMPTNEKPPSYNVNVVGVTYTYRWQ